MNRSAHHPILIAHVRNIPKQSHLLIPSALHSARAVCRERLTDR
jgi:hypothetical protein